MSLTNISLGWQAGTLLGTPKSKHSRVLHNPATSQDDPPTVSTCLLFFQSQLLQCFSTVLLQIRLDQKVLGAFNVFNGNRTFFDSHQFATTDDF